MDEQYKGMGPDAIAAIWKEVEDTFVKKDGNKVLSEVDFTKTLFDKLNGLTKDYEGLDNLPAINGTELDKDSTWDSLGLPFQIQNSLNSFTPRVNNDMSVMYNTDVFGEGTYADWFTVNHMTTVRLTVVILATPTTPIENGVPVQILTEQLPAASDGNWKHLGRYTDAENVAIEFQVDQDGYLYMNSMGQIPSDRTYSVTFTYVSA